MTRKRTTDDAALLLLRLDPTDGESAGELAEALRALARQRSRATEIRVRLRAAAELAAQWAAGRAEGEAALGAAAAALEAATGGAAAARTAPSAPGGALPSAVDTMLADFERETPVEVTCGDPELLEAFVAESLDLLQQSEAVLLELEHDPGDRDRLNTVFRCFHTVKGTSSFLGLDHIGRLAHRAESLLALAREGRVELTGGNADLALRAVDALGQAVHAAGNGGAPPADASGLLAALDAAVQGSGAAAAAPATPVAAAADGPAAEAPESRAREGDATDAWVRVRTDRLDRLVEMVGELVIAHAMIAQDPEVSAQLHDALSRKVGHAGKIVRELQELSLSMRMVPLKPLFQRLARVARDAAQRTGKRIVFSARGEDTELDRTMVETLSDPLVHMIRNAVDHGIEGPQERQRLGKSAEGHIQVSAFHASGNLVVELSDDGRGLDRERIRDKAIRMGLAERDRNYSDRDVYELIFAPGFSTAAEVTALSGRGVGMDVVRRGIEALRGRIDIDSAAGTGSTFGIRLPLTLAITDGMLVRVGEERFIIPTVNIQVSFRPTPGQVSTVTGEGELVRLRDELLPIVRLHALFGGGGEGHRPEQSLLVVVHAGERKCALLVDELLGQQQVVAKTLGNGIGKVAGLSGGAILGDGRVGLIVDVGELMGLARDGRAAA